MKNSEQSFFDDIIKKFDAFEVFNNEDSDQVVGRIGLVGTLYLPPNPDLDYRERIGEYVESFINKHREFFQWKTEVINEEESLVRSLMTEANFVEAARRLGSDSSFSGIAGSSPADADYPESIPGTHQIQFYFPGSNQPGESGHIRFSLPFKWEYNSSKSALLSLMRDLCNLIMPLHGSAGMGFVYPPSYEDVFYVGANGSFYTGVYRFPGIDATPPVIGGGELDALPSLNWLTAVSDPFLEQIGGVNQVKKALENEPYQFYEYPNGILIQAGSAPLSGDRVQGIIPLLYRKLYHVLKPIMMKSVENPFVLDGENEDEEEMFVAYTRRFE